MMPRITRFAMCWIAVAAAAHGQVQHESKITNGAGGIPPGTLPAGAKFGYSIAPLISFTPSIPMTHGVAIGAITDSSKGAAYIALLSGPKSLASDPAPGTVVHLAKLTEGASGFPGPLAINGGFGAGVAALGDIDGDTFAELAIGNPYDDTGGPDFGALWIVSLNPDGTVSQSGVPATAKVVKIADGLGGFRSGQLSQNDDFGVSLARLPDFDSDGVPELLVGAHGDDDGAAGLPTDVQPGAAYILFLNANGTVKHHTKLSQTTVPGLTLGDQDLFGESVGYVGQFGGLHYLAFGAIFDKTGGSNRGAVWIVPVDGAGAAAPGAIKIASGLGGFPSGLLDVDDRFGYSIANLGDRDGDGMPELAVGTDCDDEGGLDRGAIYVLSLRPDFTVKTVKKISSTSGSFAGPLNDKDRFAIASVLPDLDGNGVADLAVGAFLDDAGGASNVDVGAVWILFMNQYGQGCAGCGGFVPTLAIRTDGTPGSPISFSISDAFGGIGQALVFAGTQQSSLSMGAGCTLNVYPPIAVFNGPLGGVGCGNGSLTFGTSVPSGVAGTTLTFQAFTPEPGAPLGFTTTNGVAIHMSP